MKTQFDNETEQKVHSSRLINLHRKDDNELNRAIERERERARKILAEQKAAAAACEAIAAAESSVPAANLPVVVRPLPVALPPDLSIDEIAMAASEAIMAIRTATDPADIAAQLKSLQRFAKLLRENPEMPEMLELAATIENFVAVAKKSTGAKAEAQQKRAEREKAAREKAEQEKIAQEKAAKEKAEKEKAAQEKAEREKAEREKAEQIKVKRADSGIEVRIAKTATKPAAKTAKSSKVFVKTTTKTARMVSQKVGARNSKLAAKPAMVRGAALKTRRVVAPKAKRGATPAMRSLHREDKVLQQALEKVAAMDDEQREIVRKHHKHDGVKVLVAMACAVLCVVGIVWVVSSNNPDVSVRVAAMQTGVQATYPSYIPRDFTLKDISSENGKITLTFYNSTSGVSFTMTEEKSTWDSAALERNYVKLNYDTNYEVTHEQGVTVYIKGSSAAWVNGGVLYKIDADAGILTKKQLRNIVTSM